MKTIHPNDWLASLDMPMPHLDHLVGLNPVALVVIWVVAILGAAIFASVMSKRF